MGVKEKMMERGRRRKIERKRGISETGTPNIGRIKGKKKGKKR